MKATIGYLTGAAVLMTVSGCALVTTPVKVVGTAATTTIKTTGAVASAPFKAAGDDSEE